MVAASWGLGALLVIAVLLDSAVEVVDAEPRRRNSPRFNDKPMEPKPEHEPEREPDSECTADVRGESVLVARCRASCLQKVSELNEGRAAAYRFPYPPPSPRLLAVLSSGSFLG